MSGISAENISHDRVTIDETKDEAEHGGETWSCSTGDSETAWRVSSGANSLKCNTSWKVMQNERWENWVATADAYLYCIQRSIHFPSDDYNRTRTVLFIWLKAQMICIDSLFIHCWTQYCIYECRQNGPNYSERCLPVTPQTSKTMKASNWMERSNQRPLMVL